MSFPRPANAPAAVLIAALAAPAAAPAQTLAPSFDCAEAETDAEDAICASDALASLDRELARLVRLALAGPHMTGDRAEALRQEQRDWIGDRGECRNAPVGLETCIASAYAVRIHEVREAHADSRADDGAGASLGPFAYRCAGLDAVLSAVFVNTVEPVVSLAWRDRSVVLPRMESASGAKYASDIRDDGPALFWTRGDTAVFAPPGEAEADCTQETVG